MRTDTRLHSSYVGTGRLLFRVTLPLLRLYIRKSTRAYVLLINGDRVLLLRNWYGDGKWTLPGGGVKKGESYKDAAIRELKEELSIVVQKGNLELLTEGKWRTYDLQYRYHLFIVSVPVELFRVDGQEVIEAKWLNFNELTSINTSYETLNALENNLCSFS